MGSLYQAYLRIIYFITDLIIINTAYIGAFYVVTYYKTGIHWNDEFSLVMIVYNIAWLFSSFVMRLYSIDTINQIEKVFRYTWRSVALQAVMFMAFLFFSHSTIVQSFLITTILLLSVLFLISRFFIVLFSEKLADKINPGKKIAILGYNATAEKLADYFHRQKGNYHFEGFFDDKLYKPGSENNFNFIGGIENCIRYVEQNKVDEVYSTILPDQDVKVERLVEAADQKCIRIKFVPDFSKQIDERFYISFVEEFPVITLRREPLSEINNRIKKRAFDIFFSSLIIILILSWLTPLLAILIKIESKGSVFFRQKRSGRDNKPFWCYKFRSMRMNIFSDEKQATKHDPRITRIGAFMRKTSIDELPQFFNVFMGDMSIAGPRPHMLLHTEQYSTKINKYMVRHLLKPGITGWAQVNGYRGETDHDHTLMQKRVEHDLWYLENWSLMLDVKILFMTVINLFRGEEKAY